MQSKLTSNVVYQYVLLTSLPRLRFPTLPKRRIKDRARARGVWVKPSVPELGPKTPGKEGCHEFMHSHAYLFVSTYCTAGHCDDNETTIFLLYAVGTHNSLLGDDYDNPCISF